jgi:hypothetical protein
MIGLLAKLLLFPVTGPVYGLQFIAERVQAELDEGYLDERRPHRELLALTMRLELGEITEVEYEAQESALLEELNAIRAYREELMSGTYGEYEDYDHDYEEDGQYTESQDQDGGDDR